MKYNGYQYMGKSDFAVTSFSSLCYIENSILYYCKGNLTKSKQFYISAIKALNDYDQIKAKEDKVIIAELSRYCLKWIDIIKNNELKADQKLIWLSSETKHGSFAPLVKVSEDLSNRSAPFIPRRVPTELYDMLICSNPQVNCESFYSTVEANFDTKYVIDDLQNLAQDMLDDCSVVSSFLSLAYSKGYQLIDNLVNPVTGSDIYSFKLYFNGCWRVVTLDNKIPSLGNSERLLFVSSYSNKNLMWPALLEKACIKVLSNSYDFPGSNIANDTFLLSGWAPEVYHMQDIQFSTALADLMDSFIGSMCVLGLGTGSMSDALAEHFGLQPNHDYAVVSCLTDERSLEVINPSKNISCDTRRKFKVSFNELSQFSYLYVNWNVNSLFKKEEQKAFYFTGPQSAPNFLNAFPQFSITNPSSMLAEMWVLLELHNSTGQKELALTIDIYDTINGEKIFTPNQFAKVSSISRNSRALLSKASVNPRSSYTIVLPFAVRGTYTLKLYHNINNKNLLEKASYLNPFIMPTIMDEWGLDSNGGSWSSPDFLKNPQYDMEVTKETNLQIGLICQDPNVLVNFFMCTTDPRLKGFKLRTFEPAKLLRRENYNRGFQLITFENVTIGDYKLIFSANDENVIAPFKVLIHSSTQNSAKYTKIVSKLGLFEKVIVIDWNNRSEFKLKIQSVTPSEPMVIHLKSTIDEGKSSFSYQPKIRGSIFDASTLKPIQLNQEWSNDIFGTYIDFIPPAPGDYILLVERFEAGCGSCTVHIGCNNPIEASST